MGNEYIASYIMFAKRLQWGWWDLLVDGDGEVLILTVVLMETPKGGMEEPSEGDFGGVSSL
jgi:hypothetical protein